MNFLIIGLGSIGKKYLDILRGNIDCNIFCLRTFKGSNQTKTNYPNVTEFQDWKEIEGKKIDCAFITNPTSLHVPTAIECAKRNIPIYIEKPLSNKIERLDELGSLIKKNNLPNFLAYVLRYHPGIQWVKNYIKNKTILHVRCRCTSYLPDWRPSQNYKESYSSHLDQGGGVILDLSHEIDYLIHLFGKVKDFECFSGRVADITVDSEEFADILFRLERAYVNLHINFISQNSERVIEMDLPQEYVKLDLGKDEILHITSGKQDSIKFNTTRDAQFLEMIKDFLGKLKNKNNFYEEFKKNVAELKLLLEIRKSAQKEI